MNETKKTNLLPQEIKSKYISRYMLYISAITAGLLVIAILIQCIFIAILNLQIKNIQKENDNYNAEKETIAVLEKSISENKQIIDAYNMQYFPMADFMTDLEDYRPEGVYIISIDTQDRLVNEGKRNDLGLADDVNDTDIKKKGQEESDEKDEASEEEIKKEYSCDLYEQSIIVRGFGESQDDISNFIYALSKLPYISHTSITAIEEHKIEDGMYNIFEVKLEGGIKNEVRAEG